MTTLTLRTDAFFGFVFAVVLLAATWNELYDALTLPQPEPEVFAQIAGALLLGFSYLLWIAPRSANLAQPVAAAAALANALIAVCVLVWLLRGDVDSALLWVLVPVMLVFAALEAWIASRSAAMLMPAD